MKNKFSFNKSKNLIVANWKMNPLSLKQAQKLFKSIKIKSEAEVVVCPPFVYLSSLKASGAQNCFSEEKGAYTGEVSVSMLKDLGCKYVIIGHSERRKYFQETDELINKKLKAVLNKGLKPIFCIGETGKEREEEKTEQVLLKELEQGLKDVPLSKIAKVNIAYEPIWAIGTGNACDVEEAQKMALLIRKIISKLYNPFISKKMRILYGGSVNSQNAAGYLKEAGFQGLLVGGASLDAKEFIKIIRA